MFPYVFFCEICKAQSYIAIYVWETNRIIEYEKDYTFLYYFIDQKPFQRSV